MEYLSYVFWVILAIMILVFVHEMGHFLFAKLFGMRVERFSIGFPPKIVGRKIGETEYVVGLTPLGGYVKIAGMVDESLDTEELQSEPQPWEFRAKPVWQRMIVITAGVVFNILLAIVIFAGLKLSYGEDYIPAESIQGVYVRPGSIAHEMGVRTGDRILTVNGRALERYNDYERLEHLMADQMMMGVARGNDTLYLTGPRDMMTRLNRDNGSLGISVAPAIVSSVVSGSAAAEAGLRPGDRIVSIGGTPVRYWDEMTYLVQATKGRRTPIVYERPDSLATRDGGEPAGPAVVDTTADKAGVVTLTSVIKPRPDNTGDLKLGVYRPSELDPILGDVFDRRHKSYGLGEALASGATDTWFQAEAIVTSLKRIVTGRENLRENVGGPIMIAKITKQAADAGMRVFWGIVGMLSVTLAVMNILPIPALDGGHLMFLVYEAIARREPSLKVRMVLQQVGMVLLLVFMAFLFLNDFLRL